MYVTYTRIYGWSDYGGESSYQPGYRLENMMWMTLLVYDYIIPVEDVQNLLGLGRSKAYEFIENVYYDRKPFRVLKIGRSYRIPCNSFDKWLNGDEERERVRAE